MVSHQKLERGAKVADYTKLYLPTFKKKSTNVGTLPRTRFEQASTSHCHWWYQDLQCTGQEHGGCEYQGGQKDWTKGNRATCTCAQDPPLRKQFCRLESTRRNLESRCERCPEHPYAPEAGSTWGEKTCRIHASNIATRRKVTQRESLCKQAYQTDRYP